MLLTAEIAVSICDGSFFAISPKTSVALPVTPRVPFISERFFFSVVTPLVILKKKDSAAEFINADEVL